MPPLSNSTNSQFHPASQITAQVAIEVPKPGDPNANAAHIVLVQSNAPKREITMHLGRYSSFCGAAKTGLNCVFATSLANEPVTYTIQILDNHKRVTFVRTDTVSAYSLQFIITNLWNYAGLSFKDPERGSPSTTPLDVTAYYQNNKKGLYQGVVIGSDPFVEPISLSDSDSSGATRLSTTKLLSPSSKATLWYDGKSFVSPAIRVVGRRSLGPQKLVPFIRNVEYTLPPGLQVYNNRFHGRMVPLGRSMAFLVDKGVGTVTADGQISIRPSAYTHDMSLGPNNSTWALVNTGLPLGQFSLSRLNADGTSTWHVLPTGTNETYVLGPDGNFWLSGQNSHGEPVARRVTPDGTVTDFPVGGNEAQLLDPVAGPDGNVWYTGLGGPLPGMRIGNFVRVTPAGKVTIFQIPGTTPPCCTPDVQDPIWASDGNLYTIVGGQYFGRITPSGKFTELNVKTGFSYSENSGSADAAMGVGPDGAIWYAAGVATNPCDVSIARMTMTLQISYVQFPGQCRKGNTFGDPPTAISAGPYGSLWYARGTFVGKILLK